MSNLIYEMVINPVFIIFNGAAGIQFLFVSLLRDFDN